MKPIYILATIPGVLLPAAGWGVGEGASEYAEEVVERSAEFQPGGRLSLVNVNGEISVRTWDRHEVAMKAEKRAGAGSEEEARLLLEETTVEFDRTEDRIDIRTELPKRNRNVTVAYTLTVPEEIALELRSANGGIQANDVSGSVDAKTTNGGIGLAGITGAVTARTTNGRIELSGIIGAASARTTNGKVDLSEVLGPIQANATNGSLEVAISELGEQAHDIVAATTNGGIEVSLPRGLKAHLKASTSNGHIESDFPVTVKGRIGKSVDGAINGGGRLIDLKTTNCSIRLKELEPGSVR